MKKCITIIVYVCLLNFASCTFVTEFEDDSTINAVIIEETVEAEIKEEVQIMELQQINVYGNYIVSGNRVFGIEGSGAEEIILKDTEDNILSFNEFFITDDNTIYFSVKVMEKGNAIPDTDPVQYEAVEKIYYFSPVDGICTEVDKSELPNVPESLHVEMDSAPFKIATFDYKGDDTSRVYQQSLVTGYQKIDGYSVNQFGLWFSVPIAIQTRLEGIYFYPLNGNIVRKMESGRIY